MEAEALGADIYSMSVKGDTEPSSVHNAYWQMRGKAMLVSAGNSGVVDGRSPGSPGVIAVTASAPGGRVMDWAAVGLEVTLAAPGESIVVRNADGTLDQAAAGTSVSTPIVAGTLALGKQKWPDATYHQLIQSLAATASGSGARSDELGYGVIDPVAFMDTDPSQYPNEPITYPGSIEDDPQAAAVRLVCDGAWTDPGLGYPQYYREGAGIDPAAVVWLPQVAKDEGWLGMAPEADYWTSDSESTDSSDDAGAAGGDRTDTADIGGLVWVVAVGALFALGVIVVTAVVVIVILRRRKKRTSLGVGLYPQSSQHYGQVPSGQWQQQYPPSLPPQGQSMPGRSEDPGHR